MKRSVTMWTVLALCAIATIDVANAADAPGTKAAPAWLSAPVRTASGLVSGAPGKLPGIVAFKGIPSARRPLASFDGNRRSRSRRGKGFARAINSARCACSRTSANVSPTIDPSTNPTLRR